MALTSLKHEIKVSLILFFTIHWATTPLPSAASDYYCYASNVPEFSNDTNYKSGVSNSIVRVDIIVPCGSVRLRCYDRGSGNHNFDVWGQKRYECSWRFTRGAATKFWCEALWIGEDGKVAAQMGEFPVFGGDVDAKSSYWWISYSHRERYMVDEDMHRDKKADWQIIKWDPRASQQ